MSEVFLDSPRPPEHNPLEKSPLFHFSWNSDVERQVDDHALETLATELLNGGANYLRSVAGEDYEFSPTYSVYFTRRFRHGAQGGEFRISVSHLREALSGDGARRDLEQSLFVHELVHNLVDEEELPMMIEFAYMIEK